MRTPILQNLSIKYFSRFPRDPLLNQGPSSRQRHITELGHSSASANMSCFPEALSQTAGKRYYSHIYNLVATSTCAHFAAVQSRLHTEY